MKFQVPQFIETEINIIGPFTLKQFLWVAAGAVFLFLDFTLFKGIIAIIIAIPIAGIAGALAFLKIDDMPLINYITNLISFSFGKKQYIYTNESRQNDILIPGDKNG
jgi:hypothetical protein